MKSVNQRLIPKMKLLRWLIPLSFAGLAVFYEWVIARWIHSTFNDSVHFAAEILFFGTSGPLLVYWGMGLMESWMEKKARAEQEARTHERRLAAITNASADAILSLSPDGKIESWNRGAELLFQIPAEEALRKPFQNLLAGSEGAEVEYEWLMAAVRESGYVRGHETVCLRADGQRVDVELTATAIFDEGNTSHGTSIILRDITRRKQRQAEIQRLNARLNRQVEERTRELAEKVKALAQANAELQKLDQTRSEFVSLVSHQIRAPLTNVRGAVERMQVDCVDVNATCTRMFAILEEQVDRLDRLVSDVLNAARIEAGDLVINREPTSVYPIVRQVVEQTRARLARRTIHLAEKPGIPLALADRFRVAEVLANLLDNADKYSPPDQDIHVDIRADQDTITLSVRDHGAGLPADALTRVFDKFYRTDSSDAQRAYGYGLGLYVCRLIVEAQGGRIWAENHPEGGAVFSFTLPAWNQNQ